jgi:hypothetical protein
MTQEGYAAMMLAGGRPVEGNRSKSGKDKPRAAAAKKAAKKAGGKGARRG